MLMFLNQTQDLYTSFAFCFHAIFYIIYSSLLYQIDHNCNNNCSKICPNGLHYYFNYKKEESHSSIEELLNNENLAGINVAKTNWEKNETIKAFANYFNALYKMMYDLQNKNLDKNCFDNIRIASFTYSKNILESNIRDFENNCYSVVN